MNFPVTPRFVARAEREGWKTIDQAPWTDGKRYRLSYWTGERCAWEHVGVRGLGSCWVYDAGTLLPTHFKEIDE